MSSGWALPAEFLLIELNSAASRSMAGIPQEVPHPAPWDVGANNYRTGFHQN